MNKKGPFGLFWGSIALLITHGKIFLRPVPLIEVIINFEIENQEP